MSGVYMWCDHCSKVVEAEFYKEYDIPDVNAGGYEIREIPVCPECHHRLNEYANSCAVCSENISPKESICECCKDEFEWMAKGMAERKGVLIEAVLDGMAEFLNS